MKNLVAVAAVLALTLASQCFAEDVDSKHDCKEAGGMINSAGQCVNKDGVVIATPAVAAPAVAGSAAAGGLSVGAIAGVAAVVAVAIAVGASGGGNDNTNHGTTGTTGTH
jgi:hypothetical protein